MIKNKKYNFSIPIAATAGEHIIFKVKKRYFFIVSLILCILFCFVYYQSAKLSLANKTLEQKEQALRSAIEQKKTLEKENEIYSKNITEIQEQTNDLKNKVTEINDIKNQIYDKLNPLGIESPEDSSEDISSNNDLDSDSKIAPLDITVKETSQTLLSLNNTVSQEKDNLIELSDNLNTLITSIDSTPSFLPVDGIITSYFGTREDPFDGSSKHHNALDICVKEGTKVRATASGKVIKSEYSTGGYGYYVEIDHGNGLKTLYAHNSELAVNVGQKVDKGDVISYSGSTGRSTGPHVHYEVILNDKNVNPLLYVD